MTAFKIFSKLSMFKPTYNANMVLERCTFLRTLKTRSSHEDEKETKTAYEKTINQVTILGRVGNEPMKRGTEEHPVVIFSVATHTNFKYESGEFSERTDWHRISVFKPSLRELVFSYLKKGQRVYVSGKLSYGSVTEGSTTRPVTSIVADEIIFFYHNET